MSSYWPAVFDFALFQSVDILSAGCKIGSAFTGTRENIPAARNNSTGSPRKSLAMERDVRSIIEERSPENQGHLNGIAVTIRGWMVRITLHLLNLGRTQSSQSLAERNARLLSK